jgi:Pvc16 N-terminal domain
MSNYLAIAVVTAAIHGLVQAAVTEAVPGVTVRIGPPRAVSPTESEVYLYLYHLTPNAQLRNADLPTRRADGSLSARSQSVIDLHYLIAFSGEVQLATETMLGKVIVALEFRPVLTVEDIRRVIRANGSYNYLKDSDLPGQLDRIKLTPQYLALEEMTKLWSVFFQIAHRPSLLYVASPIILDADDQPSLELPVASPRLSAGFSSAPRIDAVTPPRLDADGVKRFKIQGANFAPGASARIESVALPTTVVSASMLEVGPPPPSISAGRKRLQVANGPLMSNAAPLVLLPVIRSARCANVPDPFGGDGEITTIQLDVVPPIGNRQAPTLWLNAAPTGSAAYGLSSLLRLGLDPSFQADLEAVSISSRGRDALAGANIPHDGEFRIVTVESGRVWTLEDASRGLVYLLRADAGDLTISFGLAQGSSIATVAFRIEIIGKSQLTDPALRVAPGEYFIRLMIDSEPAAISALSAGGGYDDPLIHIPG